MYYDAHVTALKNIISETNVFTCFDIHKKLFTTNKYTICDNI